MYPTVLFLHSCVRYLIVAGLACTISRAVYGWLAQARYTRADTAMRSATVSAFHLQVMLGFVVYFLSPLTQYFYSDMKEAAAIPEVRFFSVVHVVCMMLATVVITIGGAKARRADDNTKRFRTTALYFLAAGVIVALAIPWPFSPFAARPWLRPL